MIPQDQLMYSTDISLRYRLPRKPCDKLFSEDFRPVQTEHIESAPVFLKRLDNSVQVGSTSNVLRRLTAKDGVSLSKVAWAQPFNAIALMKLFHSPVAPQESCLNSPQRPFCSRGRERYLYDVVEHFRYTGGGIWMIGNGVR